MAKDPRWLALIVAMRGDNDDHPGRHDRDRGAPVHPKGPRLLAVRARLGGQRLPDRVRRPAAARRASRRPGGPQADLHHRPGGVHRGVAGLRPVGQPAHAGHREVRAGHRRCPGDRRGPWHGDHDVPRAAAAGEGDRRVQLRRGGRRLGRRARRRPDHPGGQLALDLLRQRPGRRRGHRGGRPGDRAGRGHRPARRNRRRRRRCGHLRTDARRRRDRRDHHLRLGRPPHARVRRGRGRAAGRPSPGARPRRRGRCCRCASSGPATSPGRTWSRP